MIQRDYEYIQGSTVRQLEYDVYQENEVLKAKKIYRTNKKVKFKMVLAILSLLFVALTVMYRFAVITQLGYTISQRETAYNELRNQNSLLRVKIESQTDLAAIKEAAETELGMQMPDKSQIVYIRVPRKDYTLVMNKTAADENSGEGDNNIIKNIANKAAAFMKLFD